MTIPPPQCVHLFLPLFLLPKALIKAPEPERPDNLLAHNSSGEGVVYNCQSSVEVFCGELVGAVYLLLFL